jgi:hypothetical protein
MSIPQVNEQIVLHRIQTEMDRHLLEHDAPEEIVGFLHQHWARLLASIFIAQGNQSADWVAGWGTVNALVWSLTPKTSRNDTEKMLHMLPALLARMHEGCAALSISMPERDALFERLAMMHAAVARAGLRCRNEAEKGITHLASMPKLEAGADLADLAELAELHPPKTEPIAFEPMPALKTALPMPMLKVGDRVHFRPQDQTQDQAQARTLFLNWISPAGGMYLFGNDQGLEAMTLTRARLVERFAQGQVTLVCD